MATNSMSILSTISGASEGGNDLINLAISNTSAVYTIQQTTLTTNGITGAVTFAIPAGVRQVLLVPPSTNNLPWRMAPSTGDTGMYMTSQGDPTLLSVSTVGSTVVLFTTATTAIVNFRVIML